MIHVFVDANLLYSNTIRSLFIWLHANKVVFIHWSIEAWEEAFRNFEEKNGAVNAGKFRASMEKNAIETLPECLVAVTGNEPKHGLKDPDDEHILSAALNSNSKYLLTRDRVLLNENVAGIQIIEPDQLISEVVKHSPKRAIQSVKDHILSLNRSQPSKSDYLDSLERSGLGAFAKWLRKLDSRQKLFAEIW